MEYVTVTPAGRGHVCHSWRSERRLYLLQSMLACSRLFFNTVLQRRHQSRQQTLRPCARWHALCCACLPALAVSHPRMWRPRPCPVGDALYAFELALALQKLNLDKLKALHRLADQGDDFQVGAGQLGGRARWAPCCRSAGWPGGRLTSQRRPAGMHGAARQAKGPIQSATGWAALKSTRCEG